MPERLSLFQTTLFGLMKDITSAYILTHHDHNNATMFSYGLKISHIYIPSKPLMLLNRFKT